MSEAEKFKNKISKLYNVIESAKEKVYIAVREMDMVVAIESEERPGVKLSIMKGNVAAEMYAQDRKATIKVQELLWQNATTLIEDVTHMLMDVLENLCVDENS